jgi:hypothetical protein
MAVDQMNQVTQQTAANAEESASAAEELASQAEEMKATVNTFSLTDATASPRLPETFSMPGAAGKLPSRNVRPSGPSSFSGTRRRTAAAGL